MSARIAVIILSLSALILPACAAEEPEEVGTESTATEATSTGASTEEGSTLETEGAEIEPTEAAAAATSTEGAATEGTDTAATADGAAGEGVILGADDIYYVHDGVQSNEEELTLTASAGEVEMTLDNEGVLPHNIVVEEADDTLVVEAEAGASETGSIQLESGDYTLYCNIEGHREAGMEASLTVE